MSHPWPTLKWWNSGERQVVEEKIDDLVAGNRHGIRGSGLPVLCCPEKNRMYGALRRTPEATVRVCIIGQDPYPTVGHATGTAFEVAGDGRETWPPTFNIIIKEYVDDLHYANPSSGSLARWTSQGVLLWNAIPVCQAGAPLSCDWPEWEELNREIIERLSAKGVVFVFLGSVARRYEKYVGSQDRNRVICTSHPSPRGNRFGKTPFSGSRIFSTINDRLAEIGAGGIDWRLDHVPDGKGDIQVPDVARGKVLPNVTGAVLGGLKVQGTSRNIYTSLVF